MSRESVKIGSIYLVNAAIETRSTRLIPVEVLKKYKHHVLCRTISMPGEYGMSKNYCISCSPEELTHLIPRVRDLYHWIMTNNLFVERCFGGDETCFINREIQEKELKRLAYKRGEAYDW